MVAGSAVKYNIKVTFFSVRATETYGGVDV